MGAGAQELRLWPVVLRPIVHWFLPSCRALRKDLASCRRIVQPVLEQRKLDKQKRVSQGLKPEEYTDTMEWSEQVANGRPYDAAAVQIMLAIVGGHTMADGFSQILYDLCDQPQLVEDLRKEIVSVMGQGEWSKSSVYRLKLLDSVMKESQRLKPATLGKLIPALDIARRTWR